MSSQTPNIGLTLPTGSENVSRQIINDNNTKIDTAIGGTAGRELLGYKENGDTASQAIADGSFVVWKGDLYKANGAISQGTAFSSSNLTAVPSGGFNDLQGQVSTLSDSLTNLSTTVSGLPTLTQVAQNLPVTGSFSTAVENQYISPGVTAVYVNRTLNSVAVNQWMVLIVAGSTANHLQQILLAGGKLFTRWYESGTWSAWTGGAI